MIYNFLCEEDLRAGIKEEFLTTISEGNVNNIIKAERAAIDFMKSYLNARFDVADCFPVIRQWVNNKPYEVSVEQTVLTQNALGEEVTLVYTPVYWRNNGTSGSVIMNYAYHEGKFYEALQDNINVEPGTDEDIWKEFDPREDLLVNYATDITLFYLHKKINPRKIPELRIDLYNQAKEWLEMVKENNITPDLPKPIDIKKDVDTIRWGSSPQKGHYY